jgi:hypothetical protein
MVKCDSKSFTRMRAINRASISSIRFENFGWKLLEESTPIESIWTGDGGLSTLVATFHNRPCHPALERQAMYRDMTPRALVNDEGGLISAGTMSLSSGRGARCITKVAQPNGGINYHGILVIPFKDCHITILVKCEERDEIGVREATVYNELAREKILEEWEIADDPCAHRYVARNLSEQERWDKYFPNHPLSRVRHYLKGIEKSFTYNPRLLEPLYARQPWWSHISVILPIGSATQRLNQTA